MFDRVLNTPLLECYSSYFASLATCLLTVCFPDQIEYIFNLQYISFDLCLFQYTQLVPKIWTYIFDMFSDFSFTATKETSYVYSLTAAAIVHHLINACLTGKAKNCPCMKSKDYQVVNCPKNLDFGFKRGKRIIKIMDYRQIHDESRKMFNLKNSLIGIQVSIIHCVKSVQIRSFFWSVFSCIRTEYRDLLRKSPYSVSEYRKIRTRKNSTFGHFS